VRLCEHAYAAQGSSLLTGLISQGASIFQCIDKAFGIVVAGCAKECVLVPCGAVLLVELLEHVDQPALGCHGQRW